MHNQNSDYVNVEGLALIMQIESEIATRELRMKIASAVVKSMDEEVPTLVKSSAEGILIPLIDQYLSAVDRLAWMVLRRVCPALDYETLYGKLMQKCESEFGRRFGVDPEYKNISLVNRLFKSGHE